MTDLTALSHTASAGSAAPAAAQNTDSGADFGTFLDTLLDIINPLQHLPVVSTLYRSITGDTIGGPARLVGDALYGGPIGAASAMVNLIVEKETGSDIGAHALALVTGESNGDAPDSSGLQLAMVDGVVPTTVGGNPNPDLDGSVTTLLADARTTGTPDEPTGSPTPPGPQIASIAEPPIARADTMPANSLATVTPQIATPHAESAPAAAEQVAYTLSATIRDTEGAVEPKAIPAWFTAALAAADRNHTDTNNDGKAPAGPSPDVISATMSRALDKYQAMAIARGAETAARPGKASGDGTAN